MSDVIEEYAHDCRIVRETENSYEEYHYEGPLGRVQSFESLSKARLYADPYSDGWLQRGEDRRAGRSSISCTGP